MAAADAALPTHLALGREAEELSAQHLIASGAEIVRRNYRRRHVELDIVALHRGVMLIVEVRFRSSDRHGDGAASVDRIKPRKITIAAQQLLQRNRDLARYPVRFDVIALSRKPSSDGGSKAWHLEWMKHAFKSSR